MHYYFGAFHKGDVDILKKVFNDFLPRMFIIIGVILVISFLFSEPIFALTVDSTTSSRYVYIYCDVCSNPDNPDYTDNNKHEMERDKYNENKEEINKEPAINCILCGGVHCKIRLAEQTNKSTSYKIMVGANSSVLQYQGLMISGGTFSVSEQLAFDAENNSDISGILDDIETNIFSKLVPIAIMIVIIYYIMDLGEMLMDDRLTYEALIFSAVKSILAAIVLANAMDWLRAGIKTCTEVFNALTNTPDGITTQIYTPAQCIFGRIINGDDMSVIGEVASASIYCLTIAIAYMILTIVCWARIFDVFLRVTFAPIGMSDFMHGGINCLAVKYFKKLIASVLQGACIAACLIAYQSISIAIRGPNGAGPVVGIILALSIITTVTKIGSVANDAIGE